MICRDAKRWLLAAEAPKSPPAEVRGHLRECPKCRRLRRRLMRLEILVASQPAPAAPPERRAAIFAQIDAEAPATLPLTPQPARRRHWVLVVRAAAVLLLTTLALWAIQWAQQPGDGPEPVAQNPPAAEKDVLAGVIKCHLELAEAKDPAERLEALAEMAAELRDESLRKASGPAAGELAALAQLHRKVLVEGVVPRAGRLTPEDRREVLPPLVEELRGAEAKAEEAARGATGGAAQSLRAVAQAARETHVRLESLLKGGTSS
jgi:hypothetical protein